MFWERNHFGSPWDLFSLFRLTHGLGGKGGQYPDPQERGPGGWLARQWDMPMFPMQITDRHYGIHSPESKFSDKGNKSLCNVTERQTPFFISPRISHWSNNISTPCMQKENVQEKQSVRDVMSTNRTTDKVETLLPHPSPSPLLVLPVALYFSASTLNNSCEVFSLYPLPSALRFQAKGTQHEKYFTEQNGVLEKVLWGSSKPQNHLWTMF